MVFVPPLAAGNNSSLRDLCGLLFKLNWIVQAWCMIRLIEENHPLLGTADAAQEQAVSAYGLTPAAEP